MINTKKLLPSSTSSLAKISNSGNRYSNFNVGPEKKSNGVSEVSDKLTNIHKFLEGSVAFDKKVEDDRKKEDESGKRQKEEEKLEKKEDKQKSKKKVNLPKIGFLDRIKNFITNALLGFFVVRLIDHLPAILEFSKNLFSIGEFVLDFSGKILDGLVSFIDWGYKASDDTEKFLKSWGGDNAVEVFEAFNGAIGKLIDVAIIAGFAMADQGQGGVLDIAGDMISDKLTQRAGQQVAGKAVAKGAGIGAGTAAAIVGGVGLLASALGEGAFQLRGTGKNIEKAAKSEYDKHKDKWAVDPRRIASWGMYKLAQFGNVQLSTVGFLLDVVGAPFRYAIELIRYPFLSEEDKEKQAHNLAKFDARIREDVRKALNMVTLGMAFKEKGSFGNMFGNDAAQKEMMGKMQGGGSLIRKGNRVTRKTPKAKQKQIAKRPAKIQVPKTPGGDIGAKDKYKTHFPKYDPENPSATTIVTKANEGFNDVDYFGPVLSIASKIILGEKPGAEDYRNVGLGINRMFVMGMNDGIINITQVKKFAGGGAVNNSGIPMDLSKWTERTVEKSLTKKLSRTFQKMNIAAGQSPSTPPGPPGNLDPSARAGGSYGGYQVNQGIQKEIYEYLINEKKLNDYQALGLMANISRESGFRADPGLGGVGEIGMFQWNPQVGRAQKMEKAVPDWKTNWKGQIDYALDGDSEYRNVQLKFKTTQWSTAYAAADYWMREYENPGDPAAANIIHREYLAKVPKAPDGTAKFRPAAAPLSTLPNAPIMPVNLDNLTPDQIRSNTGSTSGSAGLTKDKNTHIYLHWTSGFHDQPSERYHRVFLGDGTMTGNQDYGDLTPDGHTAGKRPYTKVSRNYNAVALSIAAMAHEGMRADYYDSAKGFAENPPTQKQLDAMAAEAARLAVAYGWDESTINTNVMTHYETDVMDFSPAQGGGSTRWDLKYLKHEDRNKGNVGGPYMRGMILQYFRKFKAISEGQNPDELQQPPSRFMGGPTGKGGLIRTHRGEYIIDKDTVDLLGTDFFDIVNKIENESQLKQKSGLLISKLSQYASYDERTKKTVVVPIPQPQQPISYPVTGNSSSAMSGVLPVGGTEDAFKQLYMGN